jgi:hypothetical protein
MAKNPRIRACPEEEATRSALADHLGHQGHLGRHKFTKENLAGPSVSMPRRIAGIFKSRGNMNLLNPSFLPNGALFAPRNVFFHHFSSFFRISNMFFSWVA